MAINFPDNPSDGDIATVGGVTYTYTASSNTWKPPVPGASASTLTDLSISDGTAGQLLTTDGNNNFSFTSIASASSTEIFADMAELITKTGMSAGDQGLVLENNKLFMYTGSAWYLIATMINNSPTAITNVDSTYNLAIDGTPTVITAVSTDPEGFPLTWSYAVTSGSLGSTATISQTDNVFTITPSTNSGDAGEFSITFSATDGGSSGIVNKVTSISLAFFVANSRYTTLLATATGTSDNNNITDSSTNNHSITVNGDVMAGTFSPYRSGGYSTYFDGSGDYLQLPSDAGFSFGTGDFTVEFWMYAESFSAPAASSPILFDFRAVNGAFPMIYIPNETNGLTYYVNSNNRIAATNCLSLFTWHHVSLSRSGTSTKLFVDGSQVGSTYTDSTNYSVGTDRPLIGKNGTAANGEFSGYISNLRIVKGTAVYTSNFTPSPEPLTAITNTTLLTCHLPYIADGSTNAHSITSNGNVTTQPFSPYDYGEYDPSIHGGSVEFDGSGDYLTFSEFSASGQFTIETWVYLDTVNNFSMILSKNGSASIYIAVRPSQIEMGTGGGYLQWSNGFVANTWYHIAIVRNASNLIECYIDGSKATLAGGNATDSTAYVSDMIGKYGGSDDHFVDGYLSNLRVVLGTAVYTSNFTPPTAPLSSSGSSLHIKGTDASIIDKSQSTNLKVFGNPTGSTTQVKFTDSKSMYFDGTGDYVTSSSNSSILGSGDFTVELWLYASSIGSDYRCICSQGSAGTSFRMFVQGTSIQVWIGASPFIIYNNSTTANTWYHIAYSHSSSGYSLYVDGSEVAFDFSEPNFDRGLTSINIGGGDNSSIDGYIQDFRITNDLARYTANFTPPAEPLKG